MKLVKWLLIIAIIAGLGWLAKPYIIQPVSQLDDTDLVEIQALGWLKAMVAQDWAGTYKYTSPGYRSGVSETDHIVKMSLRRVRWLGGEILSSQCDTEACVVDTRIVIKVISPMRGVSEFETFQIIHESWVKADGQWWFVP